MRTSPSYLEIHIHGVDGYVSPFVQSDTATIQKLLPLVLSRTLHRVRPREASWGGNVSIANRNELLARRARMSR